MVKPFNKALVSLFWGYLLPPKGINGNTAGLKKPISLTSTAALPNMKNACFALMKKGNVSNNCTLVV